MRGVVRTAMQTSPGVAIEMLTSGTTGTPKRVPLSRESFDASFRGFTRYERGRSFDDPPTLSSGCTSSEEHTSELQSLMRNSYAVFRLKKQSIIAFYLSTQNHPTD